MAHVARTPTVAGSWWALFVLFLANIFNQGDRILFGTVVDPIGRELAISDTQMSLASGLLFVLFNLIGGLFIARFVDRGNRVRILAIGVAGWSLATAATGLATDFATLSLARIVTGIGEATAFPAAMSLIPDLFRANARGRAIAIFQTSSFVGIVGGTIIGGVLAAAIGWRYMFVVCGLSGLSVTALLLLSVREPLRTDDTAIHVPATYWVDLWAGCKRVLALPGYPHLLVGFGVASMMTFVLAAWGPTFLLRSHDVPLAQVGIVIGPAVGLGGITGTLASGFLSDRLMARHGRASDMLKLPMISVPLALPFMAGFIFLPTLAGAMACAAVMNFLLSMAMPPAVNFALNSVASRDRGIVSTILLAASGLIGGALGPFIVGALSDTLTPQFGDDALRMALSAMLATPALGALFLFLAYRRSAAFARNVPAVA
jgi:MFS family permease